MQDYTEIFKLLSDEKRLKLLLSLLEVERQVCVCDLEYILDIPQYAVSRSMKDFRGLKLVEALRKGKYVYYQLKWPQDPFFQLLKEALVHISLDRKELFRLKELLSRKDGEKHLHCEK